MKPKGLASAVMAGGPGPRLPPVGGRHPAGFLVYRPRPVGSGVGGAEARRAVFRRREYIFDYILKDICS